jgi:demethylmenaquinone methyltransferase/2-methoxy-6-polyprenyl-1,4-benzoquinol methylase
VNEGAQRRGRSPRGWNGAAGRSRAAGRGRAIGGEATAEPLRIRRMFDGIAGSYDRMNDLMTAGLHHRWREIGVMLAQVGAGASALDVCCGTGDFAFALRRAVGPDGRVVGVDVSEEMLDVARDKCGRNQLYVEFRIGDVLDLPFADGRQGTGRSAPAGFDACTVGFGIRNVPDVVKAFSEMRRVCRPGGKVVCLEITRPSVPVFKQFYKLWFDMAVPLLGRTVSGDKKAYSYLPASVRRFPEPEELKSQMEEAGLKNVRYEILAGGIIAVHHAWV